MSSRSLRLSKPQLNGLRKSEEEPKLECVFCWSEFEADGSFGVVNTSNGTYFLCQECNHRG